MIGTIIITSGYNYYQYIGDNKFQHIYDPLIPNPTYGRPHPVTVDNAQRTLDSNEVIGVFPEVKFVGHTAELYTNQDLSFLKGVKR